MTLKKMFIVRLRGPAGRRIAYIRRVDQKDAWLRVRMTTAQRMIKNGTAVPEEES